MITWKMHPLYNRKEKKAPWLPVYAGWDIGFAVHPSHFCAFAQADWSGERVFYQIASCWWDHVPYDQQLSKIKMFSDHVYLSALDYDATRGEMGLAGHLGMLLPCMEGVSFSGEKIGLAQGLEISLGNKEIVLLPDNRQTASIKQVRNDLNADASSIGHADAFWSIALALRAMRRSTAGGSILDNMAQNYGVFYKDWPEAIFDGW